MSMVEPGYFISTSYSDQAAVTLLNRIFEMAVRQGVSDVHLESVDEGMIIRFRIDGRMTEIERVDARLGDEIDTKIRMKARISISERSVPHDSRMHLEVDGRSVDARVSILPVRTGASIVCRLLDQSNATRRLAEVDMTANVRGAFASALSETAGMIVITGPTGSGKTSTLYACLNEFSTADHKILTLEDPVEYRLPGAMQTNISPEIGMTFAKGLRSALRQDPDIILVGEIRDTETAKIAAQAALTGHLVLTTLHANDAASTITRLIELGVEPFVLGIALRLVVAQRLVPKLCPSCRQMFTPNGELAKWVRKYNSEPDEKYGLIGHRCHECSGMGEQGRIPVMEAILMDKAVREAAEENDYYSIVQAAQEQPQFELLGAAGLRLAKAGIIGLDRARSLDGSGDLG